MFLCEYTFLEKFKETFGLDKNLRGKKNKLRCLINAKLTKLQNCASGRVKEV